MEGIKMRQNTKNVSPMSNEGRNQYVVEHITDALLKLMKSNDFNDISISQICEAACVGRASFYRNFESKEAVISRHLKMLLDNWWSEAIQKPDFNLVETIFSHYWEHRELCILLYRQGLAHLSLQSIKESCGPKPEQPNIVAYTTAYFSCHDKTWRQYKHLSVQPETGQHPIRLYNVRCRIFR